MRATVAGVVLGSAFLAAAAPAAAQSPSGAEGVRAVRPGLVVVRMVERGPYGMGFDPMRLTAHRGDTLRFVQHGRVPHNVEFRSVPEGVVLGAARVGPFLERVGATYDLVLDERFAPGKYFFVCTPHEVLGMAGILRVEEAAK